MSAEDLWQLKIPIRLSLAQDEISSPGDVKPVHLLAPRFAYLPALAQQCLSFFQHVLLQMPCQDKSQPKPAPWFEYEGLALNWTQPLGVLHDLLTPQPTQQQQQQSGGGAVFSTSAIPWCLTVHFRNQPASLANGWQNAGSAQDHFLTSLKEAGYCCRGTDGCNAVMRLTVQDELWAAVNRGDGVVVRQHLTPLRLVPTERQGSKVPTAPVRLFIRQHKADGAAGLIGVWSDVYSTNRAIEVQQPDGSATLLAHLVHVVMPQRFPAPQQLAAGAAGSDSSKQPQHTQLQQQQPSPPPQQQELEALPSEGSKDAGSEAVQQQQAQADAGDPLGVLATAGSHPAAAATPDAPGSSKPTNAAADAAVPRASSPSQVPAAAAVETAGVAAAATAGVAASSSNAAAEEVVLPASWPSSCAMYVCGVQPDWRTPLGWLHTNFKAADGFLYVVVHLA